MASVAQSELTRQTNNAADKLYNCILEDVQRLTNGKVARTLSASDAKKLVGLAVAFKDNPTSFEDQGKAELGVRDVPNLVKLQCQILARVHDHARSARLQSSVSAFSGGARESLLRKADREDEIGFGGRG